jgi:hypothetical protein
MRLLREIENSGNPSGKSSEAGTVGQFRAQLFTPVAYRAKEFVAAAFDVSDPFHRLVRDDVCVLDEVDQSLEEQAPLFYEGTRPVHVRHTGRLRVCGQGFECSQKLIKLKLHDQLCF